jgi:two-component system cell cycle sensor histidine kinase/response regulator CckA
LRSSDAGIDYQQMAPTAGARLSFRGVEGWMRQQSRATVLVVDDLEHVRAVLSRHLRSAGHHVLESDDGAKALRMIRDRHGQVDLVITDVVMLGMNGTALVDRLVAEFPHVAVVLMSAFAPPGLSRVGFGEAIIPVLQKPFKPSQLDEIVRMTLRRPIERGGSAAGGEG